MGYTEFNLLTQEILAAVGDRKQEIYNVLSQYAMTKVSDIIGDYVAQHGSVFVDPSITANGNSLFKGDGSAADPINFNLDGLIKEMDSRYSRNSTNPLTSIGGAADRFLPITTGFFNMVAPFVNDRVTQAVGYVEKDGVLLTLVPATDGSLIRYAYGYVKDWNATKSIDNYQTTITQYHPSALSANEEIMDLFGITNETMLGSIYTIDGNGKALFKEHCLIELNGSLMQAGHEVVRLGPSLNNVLGSTYLTAINYRPNIVKLASGAYYLFHLTGNTGELKVYQFDKSMTKFTLLTNWAGTKLTKNYTITNNVRVEGNPTEVSIETGANTISPFHWLKSDATDSKDWIMELVQPSAGYTINRHKYPDDFRIIAVGNTVYCHMTFGEQFDLTDTTKVIASTRQAVGATLEIKPSLATPEYRWIRSQCPDDAGNISDYVKTSTGTITKVGNGLSYQVPIDMAGAHADYDVSYRVSNIALADGSVIYWRPQSSTGMRYSLSQKFLGITGLSAIEKFNGYLMQHEFLTNGEITKTIDRTKLNIANQTIIPVRVATHVIGDVQLIQTGRLIPDGSTRVTDYYLYRPSTKIVTYPTIELGTILGYGTSDDRKLLATAMAPIPWVNSRDNDGNCRYSNMVFYRPKAGAFSAGNVQTAHRSIALDYDNNAIIKTTPYSIDLLGFQYIEDIATSYLGELYNSEVSTWGLYVSPELPSVGLLDFVTVNAAKTKYQRGQVGVKLTWSNDNKLSAILANPSFTAPALVTSTVVDSVDPLDLMMGCQWTMQFDANKLNAHWHGRSIAQIREANKTLDTTPVLSFLMIADASGANSFSKYHTSESLAGYSTVITTERSNAIMLDRLACGVQRIALPFLDFQWTTGDTVSNVAGDAFVWYSARSASYKSVNVLEDIPVALGGVASSIGASSIIVTDPNHGDLSDITNKTIYVYVLLERGKPRLHFSDAVLPESTYVTYIGKYEADDYGILTGSVGTVMRLGNYRPSPSPRGSAFSVSSYTAGQSVLLNWDADNPSLADNDLGDPTAGIDPSQYQNIGGGTMTFYPDTQKVNVTYDGKFYIKNKDVAIQRFGNFYCTHLSGGVNGARGYLNGRAIWKGKGTWNGSSNYNNLVKEGWNTVHMEWGEFTLQGPFLKILT
jgi:hypothetical protein